MKTTFGRFRAVISISLFRPQSARVGRSIWGFQLLVAVIVRPRGVGAHRPKWAIGAIVHDATSPSRLRQRRAAPTGIRMDRSDRWHTCWQAGRPVWCCFKVLIARAITSAPMPQGHRRFGHHQQLGPGSGRRQERTGSARVRPWGPKAAREAALPCPCRSLSTSRRWKSACLTQSGRCRREQRS